MTLLLILARATQFISGMIFAGVFAFRWLVLFPALNETSNDGPTPLQPFLKKLAIISSLSALALLVGNLALFWLTTATMAGTTLGQALLPDTLGTVLFQTRFGTVCLVRLALAGLLALLLRALWKNLVSSARQKSPVEITAGLLAASLLLTNAWTGHAAAANGPSLPWRIAADALHLLATAVWPAGLVFFAIFLRHTARNPSALGSTNLRGMVQRFSQVSLVTVGVLVLTGIANTCFLVGGIVPLFVTTYGQILCAKLSLFALILCAAAWNRHRLVPALHRATNPNSEATTIHQLRTFVLVEIVLATAIVLVVSLLGITPPPR